MGKETNTQAIEKWLRMVDKPLSKRESKEQESKLERTEKPDIGRIKKKDEYEQRGRF